MTSTMTRTTEFVRSADGTEIAYEVTGSGPALVLVDGGLCQRSFGPARGLAAALADSFTVYCYDRRGRGESGAGVSPWQAGRELEDLAAVLTAAGGRPHLFGSSSGAVLALEAARQGLGIGRLVVYEAPFIVDDTHAPDDPRLPERVQAMVAAGRRSDAVRAFLRTVGVPAPVVALMRFLPVWKQLTQLAHTLPYDLAIVVPGQQGDPLQVGCYDDVASETLVIAGGKSPEYLRNAQAAIAAAVPHGRLETLPGQTHLIRADAVAPVVRSFLAG
ncbi:MAG: alpha/beta fold hydrolase [Friedmanniella sp.]